MSQPAMPPGPPPPIVVGPPWGPPPRPHGLPAWAIVVIAVVVIVVVLAVATLMMFVLVSGLISSTPPPPTVTLAAPTIQPSSAQITVAAVSMSRPLAEYSARLFVNGSVIGALEPLRDGSDLDLAFNDLDAGGSLSPGDQFVVTTVAPGDYQIVLLYRGSQVAGARWSL